MNFKVKWANSIHDLAESFIHDWFTLFMIWFSLAEAREKWLLSAAMIMRLHLERAEPELNIRINFAFLHRSNAEHEKVSSKFCARLPWVSVWRPLPLFWSSAALQSNSHRPRESPWSKSSDKEDCPPALAFYVCCSSRPPSTSLAPTPVRSFLSESQDQEAGRQDLKSKRTQMASRQYNLDIRIDVDVEHSWEKRKTNTRVPTRWFHGGTEYWMLKNCLQQNLYLTLHGDSEVNNRGACRNLRSVRRIRQLGGDVQRKSLHDIHLLVSNFHLQGTARFDEVLLQDVVQGRIKLLCNVLDEKSLSQGEAILQMSTKVLVVQVGQLAKTIEQEKEEEAFNTTSSASLKWHEVNHSTFLRRDVALL